MNISLYLLRPRKRKSFHFKRNRKIYCLTGTKGTSQAEDRLESYFHVMQRHGLYYDESYYTYGDFWRDAPVQYAQRLISGELTMPDAVVCANDIMADTLIAALEKAGIRVPQDVAVTGFDGYLDNTMGSVSLTSFPHSCYQLGADAFRRLFSMMTGRSCRRLRIRHSGIQIGQSCGCLPVIRQAEKTAENSVCSLHTKNGFITVRCSLS